MKKLVAVFVLLVGCGGGTSNWGPDPDPVIRPQKDDYYCAPACNVMKSELINDSGTVGCSPLGDPVKLEDGGTESCEQWCIELIFNGIDFNPKCISEKITKCSEIESICNTQQ